jgi:DNA helicase-2/ATP-dependent DNA helicase PcrA
VKDILKEEYSHYEDYLQEILALQTAYERYKASHNLMDYDDLLIYLRKLLRDHAGVRKTLEDRYRYVMVDEYQDTNKIQAEIVALLVSNHKNLMVVGDDAQSIYSFRGATVRNILDFPEQFPGCTTIKLEENYRSTQPILNLTNEILRRARE